MAHKTSLRSYIRSGLLFLLHRQPPAAGRQLPINPSMAAHLSPHHQHRRLRHVHSFALGHEPSASPSCSYSSLGAAHSARRLLPFPDLTATATPACFPLLSTLAPCRSSRGEDDADLRDEHASDAVTLLQNDTDHWQDIGDDRCSLMAARSHSCSKLPHSRSHSVPSLKSLLRRTHSQGRLHDLDRHTGDSSGRLTNQHSRHERAGGLELNAVTATTEECTHLWSPSNLRNMRRTSGRSRSFHGELEDGWSSSCGKGKRAPKGHVAVYVDGGRERQVVPIPYLSHPSFEELLRRAESEYGYAQRGGLMLPCSLSELLCTLNRICLDTHNHNQSQIHSPCHSHTHPSRLSQCSE